MINFIFLLTHFSSITTWLPYGLRSLKWLNYPTFQMCLQSGAAVLDNYHQSVNHNLTGGRCCFNEVIALCSACMEEPWYSNRFTPSANPLVYIKPNILTFRFCQPHVEFWSIATDLFAMQVHWVLYRSTISTTRPHGSTPWMSQSVCSELKLVCWKAQDARGWPVHSWHCERAQTTSRARLGGLHCD